MARLVILTHEFDRFAVHRLNPFGGMTSTYLLFDLLRELRRFGHDWRQTRGPRPVPGDVALLHVDCTHVGEEYLALASHYRSTLNFGTGDISKRKVSSLLLSKGDDWDGQVIVKGNLNCNGVPEYLHNLRAQKSGRPPPHPGATRHPYRVLDGIGEVDEETWANPELVVERFIPEIVEGEGFALRTWVFLGASERCTRSITPGSISKAGDVIRHEPVDVPHQLRLERERLKFDFGKFDFVIHDGSPILFDTNRTPGTAVALRPMMIAGARNLAKGLDKLLREGRQS